MARARNIKPGFLKNEELSDLPPLARLLFAGLWMLADREGRLEDRPKRIKTECLPYDNCEIDDLLWQLHDKSFIIRYKVGETRFIQIPKFSDHQHPHANESASKIPEVSSGCRVSRNGTKDFGNLPADSGNALTDSGLISDCLITDPLISDSLIDSTPKSPHALAIISPSRRKPKRKIAEIAKALGTVRLAWWKDFWAIYPCHDDPRSAMDAFERTVFSLEDWAKVRAGAVRYRAKADADPELKLKYGQGWINGERWEDETTRARASPVSASELRTARLIEKAKEMGL